MKDIILVIPPRIVDDFGYTPAGAALLKGSLQANGFSSHVIDLNADIDQRFINHSMLNAINNFFFYYTFYNKKTWDLLEPVFESWAEQIVSYNPTWVGMSVFSYNSHRATRLLAIAVKKRNPNIKIVIGGGGIATDFTFPETLQKQKIIDAYIRGEGEIALVELLKGNLDHPGINGKPPVQIVDVDSIPFPNYDDYELKTYTNLKGLEALPITGSRGCVRKCTFCDIASMWPKYYYRSGKNIADEIKHQVNKYGVTAFRFTDSLINGSMKAFREMIVELSAYRQSLPVGQQFIWDTHFIVRSRSQMPPRDFDTMKAAGAGTMLIGIESGSPKVRDHMKKGYSQEDLDYTIEQLNRVGIKIRMLMIVGYPTETEEDFQQTVEMFKRYKPYLDAGTIEEVNLGLTLNLLKNTPLHDNKEQFNLIQPNDHVNDWVCLDNPTLTYKERLRRRIILQATCESLGYPVFESKNYLKQLISSWNEVCSLPTQTATLIKNIRYDREQNGLTAEIINEN
jgi:anaerobic magnesium-protoporphyrin IX monomethyl ester cyclase